MYVGSISHEAQRSMICIIAVRINLPPLHRFVLFNTIEPRRFLRRGCTGTGAAVRRKNGHDRGPSVFCCFYVSHAPAKSRVGRSGHNRRQLVTIHTSNSMPSEMPSKCGVQRAELYTMGKPDGGDQANLSPRSPRRVRAIPREITISPRPLPA